MTFFLTGILKMEFIGSCFYFPSAASCLVYNLLNLGLSEACLLNLFKFEFFTIGEKFDLLNNLTF